ncbi:Peroxiredoxin [Xenococcus sp. PCC 7305]|uniref:peroxiredoxin-like family protein n=1 Tax=Xenococcus sp. PCC 7305 TaxID=102125 RepID=UPI0002ACCD5C|nr:peroxiredoxin-like family protein [Xenococcus sp. PCC 7305]ELS03536.1 Peroxiredoxin [Xenococcus sp. PCC 7305]
MNLTEELTNFRAQFKANQPEEIKEVMAQATTDLMNAKISEQSLKVGDIVPNFSLPDAVGNILELQTVLGKGAVVISFYRGGWCPYCNLELRALQQSLPEIKTLGANLIAISPETPDNSLSTSEKNELTFDVLSDSKNQVAKQFGLVFTLANELRPIYNQFGIDIPAYNGDNTFELPIPATYVVASDGKIIHSFVNVDYTQRLDPREIITALKNIAR